MGYTAINLGTAANNGSGSDARAGGSIINENFKELFSRSFKRDQWIVTRWTYDPSDLQFDAWLDEDVIEGWVDTGTKDRWIRGIILDADSINLMVDIDDPAKFLLLIDKQIIS